MIKSEVICKVVCFGSIITISRKINGIRERKRIFVADEVRKEFSIPTGWVGIFESHLIGLNMDKYPKLRKIVGNNKIVELPENKNLWYDRRH